MRILTGQGGAEVFLYEQGDLVRLVRDEEGPLVTAFAGDWGRVTRVHGNGDLDIKLAGYGRARDAGLTRALGVPRARVEPCDERGLPLPRRNAPVWNTRRPR